METGRDIDAFVATNQYGWDRLRMLTVMAHQPANLTPDELDELLALYQRTGAHLAHARVAYRSDPYLVGRLTFLVGEAHGVLYGQRSTNVVQALRNFFVRSFPSAVWELRRFIVVSALLTLVPWMVMTIWIGASGAAFELTADPVTRDAYIGSQFEDYYSSQPAQNFASQVFFNNVRVAILAFAAGILLCVFTAAILVYNGLNVGVAGGLFTHVGEWEKFWGLILPHGMLELSAVIVAGAAGLRLGWTVITPGDRTRGEAISAVARSTGNVILGLVVGFGIAALVEGFVTGRDWPTWLRIGIGALAFAAFWGWTYVYSREARRAARTAAVTDGAASQRRPDALSSR